MTTPQIVAFAADAVLVAIAADIASGADAEEIGRNEDVSHLWGARGRIVLLLLPCMGFNAHSAAKGLKSVLFEAFINTALMWIFFGAIFWLVFDIRLNQRRKEKRPWYYLGSGEQSAAADDWVTRNLARFGEPGKVLVVVKLMILFLALIGLFAVFKANPQPLG